MRRRSRLKVNTVLFPEQREKHKLGQQVQILTSAEERAQAALRGVGEHAV